MNTKKGFLISIAVETLIYIILMIGVTRCESPVETSQIDTVYVQPDTVVILVESAGEITNSPFSVFIDARASDAPVYHVPNDSFLVVFRSFLTKINNQGIDSVWVRAHSFDATYATLLDVSTAYIPSPLQGWLLYAHVEHEWTSRFFHLREVYNIRVGISLRYKLTPLGKVIEVFFGMPDASRIKWKR